MEIMHKIDPLLAANLTKTPNVNAELSEVAEQFEAIFINQFLAQSERPSWQMTFLATKGLKPIPPFLIKNAPSNWRIQLIWELPMRLSASLAVIRTRSKR